MKRVFIILAAADMLLLAITAIVGLSVKESHHFDRHFLLGLMAGLFTCFVHVATYMAFVVSDKIYHQALAADQVTPRIVSLAADLKLKVMWAAMSGILSMLVAIGLGGAIDVYVTPQVHLLAAFAAVFLNGVAFTIEYMLIDQSVRLFNETFEARKDGTAGVPTRKT